MGHIPCTRTGASSCFWGGEIGGFQVAGNFEVGCFPRFIVTGDFNGDGVADLAVVLAEDVTPGSAVVLLGNGDGSFQAARRFAVGTFPLSVAAGDFNGDGVPDLAVSIADSSSSVALLLGNGDATFQAPRRFAAASGFVTVGDFNGDGRPDLVATSRNCVLVLINDTRR